MKEDQKLRLDVLTQAVRLSATQPGGYLTREEFWNMVRELYEFVDEGFTPRDNDR